MPRTPVERAGKIGAMKSVSAANLHRRSAQHASAAAPNRRAYPRRTAPIRLKPRWFERIPHAFSPRIRRPYHGEENEARRTPMKEKARARPARHRNWCAKCAQRCSPQHHTPRRHISRHRRHRIPQHHTQQQHQRRISQHRAPWRSPPRYRPALHRQHRIPKHPQRRAPQHRVSRHQHRVRQREEARQCSLDE